ncbi:MAG: amino acid permease [Candidatus Riflebacteria bacterium HGW-Riflebacteria-2]|jgi:amino acid transporter|nr:MAG: amino acid permease [Candidatus Riflebacteria bacterium HGW-Riflebacteria-2]
MFLRFPTVVGYAGLWSSLLILLAGKSISVITALSLASISTNMRVKGGGAYFLISRSLGVEFGGVIAVFFYIAQAIAVTLYVIGFTEAVFSAIPDTSLSFQSVATITNLIVFISVFIGAGWTIKLQYGILAIMTLSCLSFFGGAAQTFSLATLNANMAASWTTEHSFFSVFALFFPAVTGIMAGVNMSGDLKNPSKSIPKGTFWSVGVTATLYAGIAIFLAGASERAVLLGDTFVIKDMAWSGALIYAGVFCATLSSALGSMMGAPRILQAFARDNIFQKLKWFGGGSGKADEPRRAIVLTFLIAQAGIMAGDLDSVAPIITMFFLLTYGTINLACFYEMISQNPSFRPTFKMHHWLVALLGALGCLAVMILINPLWATIAMFLAGGMFYYIERSEIIVQWGDLHSGLAYEQARKALLRLENEKFHPKNWRPSILALSGGTWNRLHLLQYACALSAGKGVVSLAQVIVGDLEEHSVRQQEAEKLMRKFIRNEELPAFPVVIVDQDFSNALKALLQCHGIGGLKPNSLLLGWTNEGAGSPTFSYILNMGKRMKKSVLVVRCCQDQDSWETPTGAINIIWQNTINSSMTLLLGFLLKENREWRHCPLRILRPIALKADLNKVRSDMKTMLKNARIEAEVVVLPTDKPLAAVRENLGSSAVILAGFEAPSEDETLDAIANMREIMALPGDVVLCSSAGEISLTA